MFPKGCLYGAVMAAVLIALLTWIYPVEAQKMITYPKDDPTVDDVLDHTDRYIGQEVTVTSELAEVWGDRTFALQNDQHLLVAGPDLLVISLMPGMTPELLEGELRDGEIVQATGTVRWFNQSELEREFGPLELGSLPFHKDWNDYQNKQVPVLVMGATEFARQQAMLVVPPPPEPLPEPELPPEPEFEPEPEPELEPAPEPMPEPEIREPEPAPAPEEPEFEPAEPEARLPQTASPLPLVGLLGFMSLAVGFWIRMFR